MIQHLLVKDLKKHPKNPRTIKQSKFNNLVKSIQEDKEYFNARPILVSTRTEENIIIGGNQRYDAAKKLKMEKVPCFVFDNLSEEDENRIMMKDNSDDFGEFDWNIVQLMGLGDKIGESWGIKVPDTIKKTDKAIKDFTKKQKRLSSDFTIYFQSQEELDLFQGFIKKLRNRFSHHQNTSKRVLAYIQEVYQENEELTDSQLFLKFLSVDESLKEPEEQKKIDLSEFKKEL